MWHAQRGGLALVMMLATISSMSCGTGSTSISEEQVVTPASAPKFLSDGFESGDFSKWSGIWNSTDVTINSNPSFARSGTYSAQIHYSICSTCGDAHQDVNRFVELDLGTASGLSNGVDHIFVRGSVYFKTPEPGGSVEIQRKVFYIKSPSGSGGVPNAYWAVVLTTDGLLSAPDQLEPYLVVSNAALGGGTTRLWSGTAADEHLEFDRWYDLQIEVRANTPGVPNGRVALWLNGAKVYESDSLDLRRDSALGISRIEVGSQADRFSYLPVDEYRYWDDLRISDSLIQ